MFTESKGFFYNAPNLEGNNSAYYNFSNFEACFQWDQACFISFSKTLKIYQRLLAGQILFVKKYV